MQYTVIALVEEASDDFIVAGVIAGEHKTVEADPERSPFYRFATTVEASSPDQAEALAEAEHRARFEPDGESNEDDEDDDGCPGHESLAGEHMGEAVYCDGTCQGAVAR